MSSLARPSIELETTCACGAVSLRVAGTVKSMFMCSCLDCQRASGTGHSAAVAVASGDVAVTGETRSFDRPAASGATTTRWFCPICGTPLLARSSRATELTLLPVGLFAGAEWFVPNQLIFARSHHDWDVVPTELPRWQTYRDVEPQP